MKVRALHTLGAAPQASRARRRAKRAARVLLVLASLILCGCGEEPTPTPAPFPTALPTPTPGIREALDGALYAISIDDELVAWEEISVGDSEGRLLLYAETTYLPSALTVPSLVERRSLVLAANLTPERYDIERGVSGVRSTWVCQRQGDELSVLANNLAWYAPVYQDGIAPAPDVLVEAAPSALPFVLLAMRYTSLPEADRSPPLALHGADIMSDLVASYPLTVTTAALRQGGVLGTVAIEGDSGGQAAPFVLYVRPNSRSLYRVEVSDYRADLWAAAHGLAVPRCDGGPCRHRLSIQRISQLPDVEPLTPTPELAEGARRTELTLGGSRGADLSATLTLPAGEGPFPCLVLHSAGGPLPRREPGPGPTERGWATLSYDTRGLGESEGTFAGGPAGVLADDAVAIADSLLKATQNDDVPIDGDRLVFVGLAGGGHVGALVAAKESPYAAAVLGSCAYEGSLFPNAAETQVRGALAGHYGWDRLQTEAYQTLSVQTWRQWLFEGQEEVSFLGRRGDLRALASAATVNMTKALSDAHIPVLLLHGASDVWAPVEGARTVFETARAQGAQDVTLRVFDGLDHALGTSESVAGWLAPEVEEAILSWVATLPQP